MNFFQTNAEIYFPPGDGYPTRLDRTTHLGIGAHADDLEILAIKGILEAYDNPNAWFTGVTVTDGRGAPRSGSYATVSDDDLWSIRREEQNRAADLGHYLAQIHLDYPSATVKSGSRKTVVSDIQQIIITTQPDVIYTHNLADKHNTHIAIALAVIEAARQLERRQTHFKLYGCEVWRGLDWLPDAEKVLLDVSDRPDLQLALLKTFDSQIGGGKSYDLAAMGRRLANATFLESHQTDAARRLVFAMDLTPLIDDRELNVSQFVADKLQAFTDDVLHRLEKLSSK